MLTEALFYSQRPLSQLLLAGVFERFARLKFVTTEIGCAWAPRCSSSSTTSCEASGRATPASCVSQTR